MQSLAAGQLDANSQTLNDTISFAGDAVNGMVAVLVNDNSAGNDKVIVAGASIPPPIWRAKPLL